MDTETAQKLRAPFPPEQIGKLPKAGTTLDYVGHAAVTDRLLQADPLWSWEPLAFDTDGGPLIRRGEKESELWVRLTVAGHTRIGVGTAPHGAFELSKQLVSDAIRNAAMRFGVALDLWAKEDLHAAAPVPTVSKSEADELRAILNAATADDRKAFVSRFGCKPGDLPALDYPKAKDWLSDLEAVQS